MSISPIDERPLPALTSTNVNVIRVAMETSILEITQQANHGQAIVVPIDVTVITTTNIDLQ